MLRLVTVIFLVLSCTLQFLQNIFLKSNPQRIDHKSVLLPLCQHATSLDGHEGIFSLLRVVHLCNCRCVGH